MIPKTPLELIADVRERNAAVVEERTRFWTSKACAVHAEIPSEDGSGRIARGPCMLPPGHDGRHSPFPPTENLPDGITLAPWEVERLLEAFEKATDALQLIETVPPEMAGDASYCAGVAMSALESLEESWDQAAGLVSEKTKQEPCP